MPSAERRGTCGRVRGRSVGVVLLDEAARAADQVQPHQVAPVVGVFALLKGGQGTDRALMPADELGLAQFSEQLLGTNANVLLLVDEEPKLVGQVEVGLVVGRGGQQDDTGCRWR